MTRRPSHDKFRSFWQPFQVGNVAAEHRMMEVGLIGLAGRFVEVGRIDGPKTGLLESQGQAAASTKEIGDPDGPLGAVQLRPRSQPEVLVFERRLGVQDFAGIGDCDGVLSPAARCFYPSDSLVRAVEEVELW